MFNPSDIIYEDNHLMVVNKHFGDLVQPDQGGEPALEQWIKLHIKERDKKPGDVFLGVVHRIDRPVSGAVLFAKTTKSLVRLNEMIRSREIKKTYWALVENLPVEPAGTLVHHIVRNPKSNLSRALPKPTEGSQEAVLNYRVICRSDRYHLLEVELITGRHHQIRAQLAAIGLPIKGDLKYGARRSNVGGGISLHSRAIEFLHPVRKEIIRVIAPTPKADKLWSFFESQQ